jgi:HEAT repeat protein
MFWYVCMTLKVIGPAAIPTLVDSIRRNEEWGKDSWSIIRMACEALGEIGPAAVPALIDLIKRSDEFSDNG